MAACCRCGQHPSVLPAGWALPVGASCNRYEGGGSDGASLRDLTQRIGHDSTAAAIPLSARQSRGGRGIAAALDGVIGAARKDDGDDDGAAGALVPPGT